MLMRWFGGLAPSQAAYEVELVKEPNGEFVVVGFSSGPGIPRQRQREVYRGGDANDAAIAWAKLARDKQRGRDRPYRSPFPGTQFAGAGPQADFSTEVLRNPAPFQHPQVWMRGQSLNLLPGEHHSRAGQAGQSAGGPSAQSSQLAIPGLAAPAAAGCPWPIALCKTIERKPTDPIQNAIIGAYIKGDNWIFMRKIEGRRVIIERVSDQDGGLRAWSRTGTPCSLPAQVTAIARHFPVGTVIDGELVAMTDDGKEALYVEGSYTNIVVAYDILKFGSREYINEPQSVRLHRLEEALRDAVREARVSGKSAIRLIPMAWTPADKQAMLDQCVRDQWEGVIVRKADAPYAEGRSGNWLRYKLLRKEMDVIVLGYEWGTGTCANTVGAIHVGLYRDGTLVNVGRVGGGWDMGQRAELLRRWQAGETGYVVRITAEGFSKANSAEPKLNRPSGLDLRDGDPKPAKDCTFVQ